MDGLREIPGFPDYYADRQGNIWSMKPLGPYHTRPSVPRKLAVWLDKAGYRYVTFKQNGRRWNRQCGQLVLTTFIAPCPEGMETCHGFNGKTDDSLENLSWGTHSKNCLEDKLRDGTDNRGEKHGLSKLTTEQVLRIRQLAVEGITSQYEIASMFGIHQVTVSDIKNGRRWNWLEPNHIQTNQIQWGE